MSIHKSDYRGLIRLIIYSWFSHFGMMHQALERITVLRDIESFYFYPVWFIHTNMQSIYQKGQELLRIYREVRVRSHGDILLHTLLKYISRWSQSSLGKLRGFLRKPIERSFPGVSIPVGVQAITSASSGPNNGTQSFRSIDEDTSRNPYSSPPLYIGAPLEIISSAEFPP